MDGNDIIQFDLLINKHFFPPNIMLMLKLLMGFLLKQYFNVFGPIYSHYNTVANFLPGNKGQVEVIFFFFW